MSFEGFAESWFRLITYTQRHLADREVPFREQPRRLPQPPTRQVSKRRLAHQGTEFRREDRARHRYLAGQRGDAPVPLRLAVDQTDRCADLRIAQRAEPPASSCGWFSSHMRTACTRIISIKPAISVSEPGVGAALHRRAFSGLDPATRPIARASWGCESTSAVGRAAGYSRCLRFGTIRRSSAFSARGRRDATLWANPICP